MTDTSVIKDDVLDTIEEMIARIDQKLTAQMNEILHAPEFQQIESAWRGLHYLVFNSETDASLKIRVMNVSKNELYRNLRLYPDARWDQSPLFKQVYEYEFGQFGGEPFGCLIGDYYFSHLPTDVQLLRDLSKIAGAAHAPFFAGAEPDADGHGFTGPSCPIRATSARCSTRRNTRPGRVCATRTTRATSAFACRACWRRLPYGAKSEPVEEFAFEEDTDGHTGEKYGWMNAAYAMAVNINRAFKEYGWCTRIRGVQSGGEVINLPTHTFPTDDGGVDLKCPTEIAISDRREHELAKAGLIPLIHRKNTDKAAFIGAQSLYKPKKYFGEKGVDATASDNLSSRLPYMFAVSRFAHYLKCMVRDKIGSMKEKDELTRLAARPGSTSTSMPTRPCRQKHRKRASRWPQRRSRSSRTRRTRDTTTHASSPSALPTRRDGRRPQPRLAPARPELLTSRRRNCQLQIFERTKLWLSIFS